MKRQGIHHEADGGEVGAYATVQRMYSDFCEQAGNIHELPGVLPLNVAIAYEDFTAGVRALRTFHGMFDTSDPQFQFDMRNAWKFDFLRLAKLRDSAIAETTRADMVIVSVQSVGELPSAVKWWLESALEQRDGDPGALVLLREGGRLGQNERPPVETYLAQCAQRSGIDFFVKGTNSKPPQINLSRGETVVPGCRQSRFELTPRWDYRKLSRSKRS